MMVRSSLGFYRSYSGIPAHKYQQFFEEEENEKTNDHT